MSTKNFSYQFSSSKKAGDIFPVLLNVHQWWNGLLDEEIVGESKKVGDIFAFTAGNGVHFSEQKLIDLAQNQKIIWLVIKSNLSFLEQPDEWENTTIEFHLKEEINETRVTFIHQGLHPKIECYESCSDA